jgi:hypothetical protein
MKRFYSVIMIPLFLISTGFAYAGDVLIIGIAPHTSPRVILEMYAPLRMYMEKTLGMSVEVVTAPNFDIFAQWGLAQEIDIAVTTGHQARLLQKDAEYKADFKAVALVAASKYFETNQLQGYRLLKANEMEDMDIYADETRKLIATLNRRPLWPSSCCKRLNCRGAATGIKQRCVSF